MNTCNSVKTVKMHLAAPAFKILKLRAEWKIDDFEAILRLLERNDDDSLRSACFGHEAAPRDRWRLWLEQDTADKEQLKVFLTGRTQNSFFTTIFAKQYAPAAIFSLFARDQSGEDVAIFEGKGPSDNVYSDNKDGEGNDDDNRDLTFISIFYSFDKELLKKHLLADGSVTLVAVIEFVPDSLGMLQTEVTAASSLSFGEAQPSTTAKNAADWVEVDKQIQNANPVGEAAVPPNDSANPGCMLQ